MATETTNGVRVEVEGAGTGGPVRVRFGAERASGTLEATAVLRPDARLRTWGIDREGTVAEAARDDVVDMAAQELIGTLEPAEAHVEPLLRAIGTARELGWDRDRMEALTWALDRAMGRRPTPAVG